MSHQLWPKDDQSFLTPDEVIVRLHTAFRAVVTDRQVGFGEADAALAWMRRIAGPGGAFSIEDVKQVERRRDTAIQVTVSEDGVTVSATVEADDGILFSYGNAFEEDLAAPLVKRIAEVLDYDCELV